MVMKVAVHEVVFKSQLLKDGHLYYPKDFEECLEEVYRTRGETIFR